MIKRIKGQSIEHRLKDYSVVGECWIWNGCKDKDGYGYIKHKGRTHKVHRVVYELFFGEPKGLVCHSCDITSCINPTHLWLGTPKSNMEDKVSKGRHGYNQNKRDVIGRFT